MENDDEPSDTVKAATSTNDEDKTAGKRKRKFLNSCSFFNHMLLLKF